MQCVRFGNTFPVLRRGRVGCDCEFLILATRICDLLQARRLRSQDLSTFSRSEFAALHLLSTHHAYRQRHHVSVAVRRQLPRQRLQRGVVPSD